MNLLQKTIADLVERHEGLRAAARVLKCDYSYLSRLRTGNKKIPSDALLKKMKLRRMVSFERTDLISAAESPAEACHTDDLAVDRFAAAMKLKLAASRAKGRSGWDSPECDPDYLALELVEHISKGDPVDVANFCMFLHQRPDTQHDQMEEGFTRWLHRRDSMK